MYITHCGIIGYGLYGPKSLLTGPLKEAAVRCCFQKTVLVLHVATLFTALTVGGCNPDLSKNEADEAVYSIIDSKWGPDFGGRANYIVNDSNLPLGPNEIRISSSFSEPMMLSLSEAVKIATGNSRSYAAAKEALYLTALSLTGLRHEYERQWFATIDGTYFNNSDDIKEVSLESQGGFTQDFLLGDGIQVSTGLAIDWLRFLTGDPRTSLASVLSASIRAPILGNGAGKLAQEELIQADRDVLYEIRRFNRFRKEFVVSTINAYYGVLQSWDQVTNAENNYQRRVESQERLVMEAEAGRRTKIDVDEAQQNVLQAMDSLVRTRQSYEETLDAFKFRLGIPIDAEIELDQNELAVLESQGLTEPNFPVEEAVKVALARRLDLANSEDAIADSLREVKLAAEGLGIQLDVFAGVEYESTPDTDFARIRFHEGIYDLGFEADLPLDRVNQRNAYRRSLINLERAKRQYAADVDTVKLETRENYRLLLETAERYRIQKNSLDLAEQRVESNKLLLDAGRVTVRIVLESQDSLLLAQNAVTAAFVSHLNAKLSFYRDLEVLEVKPDGMWQPGRVTSRAGTATDSDIYKGEYDGKGS
jgi:outer membrane protein TolC